MRQHLTVEEWNTLTDKQRKYFEVELYMGLHDKKTVSLVTIGVLQAILLDAGYDVSICINNSEDNYNFCVEIWSEFNAIGQDTSEPIEVLFQAVKELVLKGVE